MQYNEGKLWALYCDKGVESNIYTFYPLDFEF